MRIELVKYGGWSELMDALNTGRVDGASVLIEMAMKAKEQGIPLKLELLGHRDGNVVITSNEIQSADELAGKTFAIPNPQSSHNILLQILLEKNGLSTDDINVVEMTPAEMPAALQNGQIDGYWDAETASRSPSAPRRWMPELAMYLPPPKSSGRIPFAAASC